MYRIPFLIKFFLEKFLSEMIHENMISPESGDQIIIFNIHNLDIHNPIP